MKLHLDASELIELLPDFLSDLYFGLSAPELLAWVIILILSIHGHRA